jgi:hypothetical protein
MSYGGTYFGSLVFGAGLVVAALTPVPPTSDSNGYGTSGAGGHVYGAGAVVTSQTPIPPASTGDGNGYGSCVYGGGVFGAGCVVTSQTPTPPAADAAPPSHGFSDPSFVDDLPTLSKRQRQYRQRTQIEAIIAAFLNTQL